MPSASTEHRSASARRPDSWPMGGTKYAPRIRTHERASGITAEHGQPLLILVGRVDDLQPPPSRSARAITLAPRLWPSRPGSATTTL